MLGSETEGEIIVLETISCVPTVRLGPLEAFLRPFTRVRKCMGGGLQGRIEEAGLGPLAKDPRSSRQTPLDMGFGGSFYKALTPNVFPERGEERARGFGVWQLHNQPLK